MPTPWTSGGNTALMSAAQYGNPEVVEALLAAGTTPLINTWTIN
jgi:ankyrin repeat protein